MSETACVQISSGRQSRQMPCGLSAPVAKKSWIACNTGVIAAAPPRLAHNHQLIGAPRVLATASRCLLHEPGRGERRLGRRATIWHGARHYLRGGGGHGGEDRAHGGRVDPVLAGGSAAAERRAEHPGGAV